MNRKTNNEICNIIKEFCNQYPELRFQQILWNLGIIEGTMVNDTMEIDDKYNEPSRETLISLRENLIKLHSNN